MSIDIPTFDYFFVPVLNHCQDDKVHTPKETVAAIVEKEGFSPEQMAIMIPCGKRPKIQDRIQWAMFHLFKAGLLNRPKKGRYHLSEEGKRVLQEGTKALKVSDLMEYPSYVDFSSTSTPSDQEEENQDELVEIEGSPGKPRHWVLSAGKGAGFWPDFQKHSIAAVGWDGVGDLTQYQSREEIRSALVEHFGDETDKSNDSLCLWEFSRAIQPGDIIYAKQGRERVLGYGKVIGPYRFDDTRQTYQNVIAVDWLDTRETALVDGTRVPIKTLTNIDSYRPCRELLESFYQEKRPVVIKKEGYTREDALRDLFMSPEQFDQITRRLRQKKNIILEGPPGVGKTFVARRLAYYLMGEKNKNRARMVQFHQSYSYEDFVQGFRPTSQGGFEIRNGIFYELCQEAREDSDRDYFLIIDEINRGNLSKIFGELMMLIEHDKRGENFEIQLANSSGPDATFFVPPNVHLIGTMNTADRSLSMVDYALRRRFSFFTLEPGFDAENFLKLLDERSCPPELRNHLIASLTTLNKTILADSHDLGRGYRIGHSFFCPAPNQSATTEWLAEIIEFEIAPLLREYWVDRPEQAEEEISKLYFQ
ncbi:AAA family ATPase [Roseibacillus persicicus]|uniref:AAA family ATPase n=1 Tax=Roseibacillus persicicus TaxID=454148 RepID=UPI00281028CC|nr:AAA family ATPase [Roseibacillus persicicus]MDQ8192521.1 AAA family ATPase [Roseibacillus persicicus]